MVPPDELLWSEILQVCFVKQTVAGRGNEARPGFAYDIQRVGGCVWSGDSLEFITVLLIDTSLKI
jgi:hypothetical protein